ncbi:MAG: exosortase system-associated protein, TIGR04073 family [Candidatus Omnitrophota bacterium]|nr:exosortase system-associated protein, TIGR04073 family [Candidatus Omnitrophota bacterium]
MKNFLAITLVVLFILNISAPIFCNEPSDALPAVKEEPAEPEAMQNPVTKFGRGLCNLVTFHFEIFEQSRRVKALHGSCAGMTYGLIKGFLMAGVRAVVGAYEASTFFIPYPADYKPILTDPVSFFPRPSKKK